MNLARFPRIRLGHMPTPLEPMPNLTKHLGGPNLWIKRDDCTGLSTGGNKTRKLEFLCADAIAQGADILITQGATQSNHARQTAAAAAKLGLACHILLEDRTGYTDPAYANSGNVLMDRLHGASVSRRPGGADMQAEMEAVAEEMRAAGRKPYVIPGGGSNPIGALGYVNCAMEMVGQANEMGLKIDRVVHGTGSTGTQAGLVVGLEGTNSGIGVLGISVRMPKEPQENNVYKLVQSTAAYVGMKTPPARESVQVNADYFGPGYGLPTPEMVEAVKMFASLEGLFLDPVYTGKAAAGLIGLVRKGYFKAGENVVFVHTGGSAGLFGYTRAFGLN